MSSVEETHEEEPRPEATEASDVQPSVLFGVADGTKEAQPEAKPVVPADDLGQPSQFDEVPETENDSLQNVVHGEPVEPFVDPGDLPDPGTLEPEVPSFEFRIRQTDGQPASPVEIISLASTHSYGLGFGERAFVGRELGDRIKRLCESGLLVVECAHPGILRALADELASKGEWGHVGAVSVMDQQDEDRSPARFDHVLGAIRADAKKRSREARCSELPASLYILGSASVTALNSLEASLNNGLYRERLREEHAQRGVNLICLQVAGASGHLEIDKDVAVWELDYLGPLLRALLGPDRGSEIDDLEGRLRRQLRDGLWPADPVAQAQEIEELLRSGVDTLLQGMSKREREGPTTGALKEGLSQLEEHARGAAFVAAYCRRLSPRAFDQLVTGVLLGVQVVRREPSNPEAEHSNEAEYLATDLWLREKNKVIGELGLIASRDEELGTVLHFPSERVEKDFRGAFEAAYPFYPPEALDRLFQSRLLAQEAAVDDAAEAMVRLAVEIASDYRSSFGPRWLKESENLTVYKSTVTTTIDGELRVLREFLSPRIYRNRVGLLCIQLFKNRSTRNLVEQHLRGHLSEGQWDLVRILIQELSRLPEFEDTYWECTLRLLEESPGPVKREVFNELIVDACSSSPRAERVLTFLREHWEAATSDQVATSLQVTRSLCLASFAKIFQHVYWGWSKEAQGDLEATIHHPLSEAVQIWTGSRSDAGYLTVAKSLLHPGAARSWVYLTRGVGRASWSRVGDSLGSSGVVEAESEQLLVELMHASLMASRGESTAVAPLVRALAKEIDASKAARIRRCVSDKIRSHATSEPRRMGVLASQDQWKAEMASYKQLRNLLRTSP